MNILFSLVVIQTWFILASSDSDYGRQAIQQQPVPGRPPLVDQRPLFTDSYIAASMQVIAYLTDVMRYDVQMRPGAQPAQKPMSTTTTTTTIKPSTSSHSPGIFAPEFNSTNKLDEDKQPESLSYLAETPKKILHQINHIDDDFDEFNLNDFSKNYDDDFNDDFLRGPAMKPTSTYVTLLSLYDTYNKAAKKLGLNRFSGYSKKTLATLIETSSGTSLEQLKFVLEKALENENNDSEMESELRKRTNRVLAELAKSDSLVTKGLMYYPPMQFVD